MSRARCSGRSAIFSACYAATMCSARSATKWASRSESAICAWLFTATFVAMLAVVPAFRVGVVALSAPPILPYVYLFFVAHLLVFFVLFREKLAVNETRMAFFVWVSVFNLFVVSVFWSFMADLYDTAQARRLYGFIAAGGTAGAIAGPAVTTLLAVPLGPVNLLLVSGAFLLAATGCILKLSKWGNAQVPRSSPGSSCRRRTVRWSEAGAGLAVPHDDLRLCRLVQHLVHIPLLRAAADREERPQLAGAAHTAVRGRGSRRQCHRVDSAAAAVQPLSAVVRTCRRTGVDSAFVRTGLCRAGHRPDAGRIDGLRHMRRAAEFAICKPARETLFNALSREEKYKAKNFMDTAVYRGADMTSGWMFQGLQAIGLTLSGIAYLAAPITMLWAAVGVWLARRHRTLSQECDAVAGAAMVEGRTG